MKSDYQYEEFYFAELMSFFDIGNQVIQLLSRTDKHLKNAETKDYYLGRAYFDIGEFSKALQYFELYVTAAIQKFGNNH